VTDGRLTLHGLLTDCLLLWGVEGRGEWAGDEWVLTTAAGSVALRAATLAEQPARWMIRRDNGRWRPSLSLTGLLAALRSALDVPAASRLRIVDPPVALPAVAAESASSPASDKPPVLVVTGFLGSGKTTLIQRMLQDPAYAGTAVIVNEFGAVALDHALLESSSEVLLLPSGCLCCAVLGDLVTTLLDLQRRRAAGSIAFERVVIETSGLADPAPILHALMTDLRLARHYTVAGVVTLVDSVHGAATLPAHVEARRQVALAGRIVLTKADVAGPGQGLLASVAALNPAAPWISAALGVAPPAWLFAPSTVPAQTWAAVPTGQHTDGIASFVLDVETPVPAVALTLLLQALAEHAGDRLLRVKGLVQVAESPDAPALVHGVQHVFEAPVWLERWPGPDRRTRLVFIANAVPADFPGRLLAAITAEVLDATAHSMPTQSRPDRQQETMMTDTILPRSIGRRALGQFAAGAALGLAPAVLVRAQPATLHLANIQSITGPSSAYGWRARDGAQYAVDQLNAAGIQVGGTTYRLQLTVQDMANDPQQAITLIRQAASEADVLAVIGTSNSVGFVPSVPAAGQLQMPMVGAGSGAPLKQWNPYSYRVNPVSGTAIPVLVRTVHAKLGFKKLGIVYDQTQDGQAGDARVAQGMAKELGYEVVAFEAFRAGDQDFSSQLATVRSVRPDALFIAAATGDGVKLASQVRELGLDAPMMTGYGSFQDPVYWDGTRGAIKGCYTWLAQDLASPSPAVKAFMDGYLKAFKQEATSFATYGADAVWAVAAALTKGGAPTRAKLQEALSALDVTTPIGTHVTFQNPPNGENKTPHVVVIAVTGRGTYSVV
jgi:G3E family GTPase/ABC-type branched-subunit amino acid transport system substrate-binding protein